MSAIGHNFPPEFALDANGELPIPLDVQPGAGWTEQMLEMADHIGAYATLRLVEAFGGQRIYIPASAELGKAYPGVGTIRDLIGDGPAATLSEVYRREFVWFPTARAALAIARRHPVLARVRRGEMTAAEAAIMLKTSRTYMSHLLNGTEEGKDGIEPLPRARRRNPGQMDLFTE